MKRPSWLRCGALAHQEESILITQGNLATTYQSLDCSMRPSMRRDVYSGTFEAQGRRT